MRAEQDGHPCGVEAERGDLQQVFISLFMSLGLNERQIRAVRYVKEKGKITNKEYRELTELSDEDARIDLNKLVEADVLGCVLCSQISCQLLVNSGDYLAIFGSVLQIMTSILFEFVDLVNSIHQGRRNTNATDSTDTLIVIDCFQAIFLIVLNKQASTKAK